MLIAGDDTSAAHGAPQDPNEINILPHHRTVGVGSKGRPRAASQKGQITRRIGCPLDSDLQRMAEHPVEARDAEVSQHLTCCSPCFNRYMEILANLKRRSASSAGL